MRNRMNFFTSATTKNLNSFQLDEQEPDAIERQCDEELRKRSN